MKTQVVLLVAILTAVLVLAPTLGAPALAKSKKWKIEVGYGDVGGYTGKAKINIWNVDNGGKTLVQKDLNFAKLYDEQGDDCCYKTYSFKKDGNQVGDRLGIKVSGGGGSWEDIGNYQLEGSKTHVSITLDEIGE